MQVVRTRLMRQCPFILQGDILSLCSGFAALSGGERLRDIPLEATHTIHRPGHYIIAALAQAVRYDELKILAARHAVNDAQLCELLGFLHSVGALHRTSRSFKERLRALHIQARHMILGIRYPATVWRRPAALFTLASASVRACAPVMVASAAVGGFFAASGLASSAQVMSTIIYGVAGFSTSIWVHEYAHLLLIRRHAYAVVLQHGLRLGIVHRAMPAKAELASACVGPIAGLAWGGILAAGTAIAGYPGLAALAVCIGLFHLSSFTPWYGDGHSIRLALKQQPAHGGRA